MALSELLILHSAIPCKRITGMSNDDLLEEITTVAMIISALEKRTGLQLKGLSQEHLNAKLRQWVKTHPNETNVAKNS
jgi:hypothetical protein